MILYFSKFKKFLVFLAVMFFVLFASVAGAFSKQLEYKLTPAYPGSNEKVEVNLSSNYFDLDGSNTTVFLDGKKYLQKLGLKNFDFKTKDFGKKTIIKIKVEKYDGGIEEREFVVKPAEVELTYQVKNPFRPFGYLGKSLALSDSELTIYAFTNFYDDFGNKIDPKTLIYQWYNNFEFDRKHSGVGKDKYFIWRLHAFPRETDITVKVFSRDRKIMAKKNIHLAPKYTKVDFYIDEDNLPFNFRNVANPELKSDKQTTRIIAIPYFMNDPLNLATFSWKLNGVPVNYDDLTPNILSIYNPPNKFVDSGNLFLRVKNSLRILQSVETSVKMNFEKAKQKSNQQDIYFNQRKTYDDGKKEDGGGFSFFGN